jgi:UDP-glucose 4-epimerase
VSVLDDFSTGRKANLAVALRTGLVRIVRGHVQDPKMMTKVLRRAQVVFHLAALTSYQLSVRHPLLMNDVNVSGTVNVLSSAQRAGVERLVFASSAAVYGEHDDLPIIENSDTSPIGFYGASKLAGEKFCQAFERTYGLGAICLRYFNVYGPRQRISGEAAVIPGFVRRIRQGKHLEIHGTGRQVRDFVHVADVVDATLLAAEKRHVSDVVNVGTGRTTSIIALADQLLALTGRSNLRKVYMSARQGDMLQSCADTSKANAMLGFQARIPLNDGLRSMIGSQSLPPASNERLATSE